MWWLQHQDTHLRIGRLRGLENRIPKASFFGLPQTGSFGSGISLVRSSQIFSDSRGTCLDLRIDKLGTDVF